MTFDVRASTIRWRTVTGEQFATEKRRLRPIDAKTAGARWIHFPTNASFGYRIFTHWYTFMLFDDGPTDAYYKRFARDHLHYNDDIVCAAGRVSRALARKAQQLTGRPHYSAAHVRRGELQFVSVRISADEWNATLSQWVRPKEVLFVLSDETDRDWFAPIRRQFHLFFLNDFDDVFALDDPNARGMVEQLVGSAPNCRTFTGTFFSTFSSYVARLRAYYKHAPNTFFYAAPKQKNYILHDTSDVIHFPFYNREWPIAWNAIDHEPPASPRPPPHRLPDDLHIADLPRDKKEGRYPKDAAKNLQAIDKAQKLTQMQNKAQPAQAETTFGANAAKPQLQRRFAPPP